jgi:hypothetical protein
LFFLLPFLPLFLVLPVLPFLLECWLCGVPVRCAVRRCRRSGGGSAATSVAGRPVSAPPRGGPPGA